MKPRLYLSTHVHQSCTFFYLLTFCDLGINCTVKMPKRVKDIPMGDSEKKRKHLSLLIAQKVKLLQRLDDGVSLRHITEEYGRKRPPYMT